MSRLTEALERYTNAENNRKAHITQNKAIFNAHEQLAFACIDAHNELEDAVVEANAGVSNADYEVRIFPQTQTLVDPDDLRANQGKTLTPELIASLVKTIQRPPRVSIKQRAGNI